MREFTSAAYNQFGMRVLILGAYLDDKEDPAITLCVQIPIHMRFSRPQLGMITMTRMGAHLSRPLIRNGPITKW